MSNRHEPNSIKIEESVKLALEEDIGIGDITGELIDPLQTQSAILLCRDKSILCGSKSVSYTHLTLPTKRIV